MCKSEKIGSKCLPTIPEGRQSKWKGKEKGRKTNAVDLEALKRPVIKVHDIEGFKNNPSLPGVKQSQKSEF
jgi:hypothetical protein